MSKPPKRVISSKKSLAPNTVIWRYLRFDRFVWMLRERKLWFSRPFKFEDRWEGLFPPAYRKKAREYAQANNIPFGELDQDLLKRLLKNRYAHFVNCWHVGEHESDAMWRLYALAPNGIAIQSTVGDVNQYLVPRPHGSEAVTYYDPSDDICSPTIFSGPHDFCFKRNSFAWEQEYRFWFCDNNLLQNIEAGKAFWEGFLSPELQVHISQMRRIVKKVVVAPGASDEFIKEVMAACSKHLTGRPRIVVERSYSDQTWESFTK